MGQISPELHELQDTPPLTLLQGLSASRFTDHHHLALNILQGQVALFASVLKLSAQLTGTHRLDFAPNY